MMAAMMTEMVEITLHSEAMDSILAWMAITGIHSHTIVMMSACFLRISRSRCST